jgi:hypothetical protein
MVYNKLTVSTERDVALNALEDGTLDSANEAVRTSHRVDISVV